MRMPGINIEFEPDPHPPLDFIFIFSLVLGGGGHGFDALNIYDTFYLACLFEKCKIVNPI